jgi:hypothetical protein
MNHQLPFLATTLFAPKGNSSVFPFPCSEFKCFEWSNSLSRIEFAIEYDVRHIQNHYISVRAP